MTNSITEEPDLRVARWGEELVTIANSVDKANIISAVNAQLDIDLGWLLDNCDAATTIRTFRSLLIQYGKVKLDTALLTNLDRYLAIGTPLVRAMIEEKDVWNTLLNSDPPLPAFMLKYPNSTSRV